VRGNIGLTRQLPRKAATSHSDGIPIPIHAAHSRLVRGAHVDPVRSSSIGIDQALKPSGTPPRVAAPVLRRRRGIWPPPRFRPPRQSVARSTPSRPAWTIEARATRHRSVPSRRDQGAIGCEGHIRPRTMTQSSFHAPDQSAGHFQQAERDKAGRPFVLQNGGRGAATGLFI